MRASSFLVTLFLLSPCCPSSSVSSLHLLVDLIDSLPTLVSPLLHFLPCIHRAPDRVSVLSHSLPLCLHDHHTPFFLLQFALALSPFTHSLVPDLIILPFAHFLKERTADQLHALRFIGSTPKPFLDQPSTSAQRSRNSRRENGQLPSSVRTTHLLAWPRKLAGRFRGTTSVARQKARANTTPREKPSRIWSQEW